MTYVKSGPVCDRYLPPSLILPPVKALGPRWAFPERSWALSGPPPVGALTHTVSNPRAAGSRSAEKRERRGLKRIIKAAVATECSWPDVIKPPGTSMGCHHVHAAPHSSAAVALNSSERGEPERGVALKTRLKLTVFIAAFVKRLRPRSGSRDAVCVCDVSIKPSVDDGIFGLTLIARVKSLLLLFFGIYDGFKARSFT